MRGSILLFVFLSMVSMTFGQYVPPVPDPLCHYCQYRLPQDAVSVSDPNYAYKHHAPSCPYYPKTTQTQSSVVKSVPVPVMSQNDQIKQMVTGMVMQSLITAIFSSNTQQTQQEQWEAQQAELARIAEEARQQKIRDSIAQVKHDKMMGLYKPLEGSVANADFKTLDGELEKMRSDASAMFDQGIDVEVAVGDFSQGTNFFGTLGDTEINILYEPDNDPMVVDLRNAKAVLDQADSLGTVVQDLKKDDPLEPKKPALSPEECARIASKLEKNIFYKERYEETIDKTLTELDKWKEENQAAMFNAFTEGFEFLAGRYTDMKDKKREPAEIAKKTMEEVLKKDPKNQAAKDVIAFINKNYLSKNALEKTISAYNTAKDVKEYYGVTRDALQNTIEGFSAVDEDLIKLLEAPELAPFLNDDAFTSACDFTKDKLIEMALNSKTAQKALESVFKAKVPYVAIAQFAVNQAYNATHWYISRQQILQLNQVHGKELETAQNLQNRIFSDQLKLDQQCK